MPPIINSENVDIVNNIYILFFYTLISYSLYLYFLNML